jgi:hypothetical protein
MIKEKTLTDDQKIKNLFLKVDFEKNLDYSSQETEFIQKEKNLSRTKTQFHLNKCLKITFYEICLNFNTF